MQISRLQKEAESIDAAMRIAKEEIFDKESELKQFYNHLKLMSATDKQNYVSQRNALPLSWVEQMHFKFAITVSITWIPMQSIPYLDIICDSADYCNVNLAYYYNAVRCRLALYNA